MVVMVAFVPHSPGSVVQLTSPSPTWLEPVMCRGRKIRRLSKLYKGMYVRERTSGKIGIASCVLPLKIMTLLTHSLTLTLHRISGPTLVTISYKARTSRVGEGKSQYTAKYTKVCTKVCIVQNIKRYVRGPQGR